MFFFSRCVLFLYFFIYSFDLSLQQFTLSQGLRCTAHWLVGFNKLVLTALQKQFCFLIESHYRSALHDTVQINTESVTQAVPSW